MGELIKIPEFTMGVDEVGLGALAGPMTVVAFAAPRGWRGLPGLDDSKALSAKRRRELRAQLWTLIIMRKVFCRIENWSSRDIDSMGIAAVHRLAIKNAVQDLSARLSKALVTDVIVDGNLDFRGIHPKVRSVVKADAKFNVVRAASVIAKVHRDEQMPKLDPDGRYGFSENKGYPSPAHKAALTAYGPGEHHRYSYAPVKEAAR